MKTTKLITLLTLAFISLDSSKTKAQDVGPTKGPVIKGGRPHMVEFIINGNGAMPNGSGIQSSLKFNPAININFYLSKNLFIGLDGSYLTANPTFNMDDYAAPFANKGFASISKDKTKFSSTSFLLTGGYAFRAKAAADRAKAKELYLRLGAGVSLNTFPSQTITQNFNGTTDVIARYQTPTGFSKINLIIKPAVQFNFWITPNFGLSLNAQYQMYLGNKDFSYTYKDLNGINFNAVPPIPTDVLNININNAPIITETVSGITGHLSFGGGIVFALKTRTKSNQTNERIPKTRTKSNQTNERIPKTRTKSNQTNERISGGARMSGFNIGGYTSEKDSINISSQDHAINTQGTGGGTGGGPKKGKVKKPSKKITFGDGDGDRTTKPNGQDDGNPFPPKNPNNKEKPKDTTRRLGHITLMKREVNPNLSPLDSVHFMEPMNVMPDQNKPITIYSISSLNISSGEKINEIELPVAYFFYNMDGKIIAVPYLIFDLPKDPSNINLRKKKFHYKQLPVEIVTMTAMPEIRTLGGQTQLQYQTLVDNELTFISMTLSASQTTFPSNNSTDIWCGVSTNCGAVFAVQVSAGTNCGSVNSFFNRVCDGLLKNKTE